LRPVADDVAALPAFLMAPTRPAPVVERPVESQPDVAPSAQGDDAPLTAPKPRRRRRARFEGSDISEAGGSERNDPSSVTE
jgi:hypothetical protein